MFEFFDYITEFFSNIANIIQHLFTALINFFNIIITGITTYASAMLSIPIWLRVYGGITLTVCALYLVVGRNSGK